MRVIHSKFVVFEKDSYFIDGSDLEENTLLKFVILIVLRVNAERQRPRERVSEKHVYHR